MPRRRLLLLVPPLLGLLAVGAGLEVHGGPRADDPEVVAAHRAAVAELDAATAALLAVAPSGERVVGTYRQDDCQRGSRAVGGLGVDTPYRLRCWAGVFVHTVGGDLAGWRADTALLHERLVAAGWRPRPRALPQALDETTHGGIDGVAGPADLAAVGYDGPDGRELTVLFAQPGEHPPLPVDDGGARGWETADRLPAGGYGVVLRVSATTYEA